jgi:hypothetical protein
MKLNFTLLIQTLQSEVLRLYREGHKLQFESQEFNETTNKMMLLREQIDALKLLENLTKPKQTH